MPNMMHDCILPIASHEITRFHKCMTTPAPWIVMCRFSFIMHTFFNTAGFPVYTFIFDFHMHYSGFPLQFVLWQIAMDDPSRPPYISV